MRIDTALRNQFQFGQTLEKIGSNPCSLAKENRRFRLSYPVGKTLRVGLVGDPDGTSWSFNKSKQGSVLSVSNQSSRM